jgi:PAS domain S-box-containing protein
MLLMEDITEQVRLSEEVRRVERHLASVVESASDMVLSTDIEGRILTWNPAAEKISGYAFEEVSESPFPQFFTDDHREEVRQTLSHLGYTSSTRLGSWELLKKDGSRLQVSWVCSPMKNDLGQTVAMVALGRDQTEQRKLEAQLMQSQKLAALGVMAGGIAHEIRNPLAICSSAAQFLLEEGLTPQFIQECAQRLQSGIHKASNIIENLLRFARPSESLETAPVDLAATLQEPLALVANQARLQKVAIKLRLPREPVVSNGVSSLLQQVFMNLYLNALHAMPQGGAITVTLEKGEGEAVVRVADTGRGIAPEDLGKIFDPFYTRSPVGRGIGLGLSITYSIVQQHLGAVEVESQVGRGSTFLVRLPLG